LKILHGIDVVDVDGKRAEYIGSANMEKKRNQCHILETGVGSDELIHDEADDILWEGFLELRHELHDWNKWGARGNVGVELGRIEWQGEKVNNSYRFSALNNGWARI
jgi:hypothetical protein